jgi:flagellar basal-body rod modification protein FlgD
MQVDTTQNAGSTPNPLAKQPIPGFTAPAGSSSNTGINQTISEADFMQLLVAQLQNQDPLNQLPPDQLASELAQFTSVSQLQTLVTSDASQLTATQANTQAVQASMGQGLIGRDVIATGNQVDVSGNTTKVIADIGGSGGTAVVTLTDGNGNTVGTYPVGAVGAGRQVLTFPTNGVAPGAYTYSLSVKDGAGNAVSSTTYVAGTVNGVDLSGTTPSLDIGDLSVPISSLVEVLPAPTSN